MLTLFAALMATAGLALAALAAYVAWRRGTPTGWSLAALLVAVAWWGLAYAAELTVEELADKSRWGDLKYLGICLLAPAWLAFVLQYVGRGHLVNVRLLALLAIEPAISSRCWPSPGPTTWSASTRRPQPGKNYRSGTGPAFWVHLVYTNLVLRGATTLFVVHLVRLAHSYRRMAAVLVAAALLPWVANLLHNFEVGWFARLDLTPFAFTVTGAVLVWGLFRERLVDLTPMARSAVVESMADAVCVVDAFGRVVDVNSAGTSLLHVTRGGLVGRRLEDLLADVPSHGGTTG